MASRILDTIASCFLDMRVHSVACMACRSLWTCSLVRRLFFFFFSFSQPVQPTLWFPPSSNRSLLLPVVHFVDPPTSISLTDYGPPPPLALTGIATLPLRSGLLETPLPRPSFSTLFSGTGEHPTPHTRTCKPSASPTPGRRAAVVSVSSKVPSHPCHGCRDLLT